MQQHPARTQTRSNPTRRTILANVPSASSIPSAVEPLVRISFVLFLPARGPTLESARSEVQLTLMAVVEYGLFLCVMYRETVNEVLGVSEIFLWYHPLAIVVDILVVSKELYLNVQQTDD